MSTTTTTTTTTSATATRTDDHLALMTALVFRSGMGRAVVEAKWDGIRAAFHGFDAEAVAAMTPDDVDALVTDVRIIRNRRKIEATIHNAGALLDIERGPGFASWLARHETDAARDSAIRRTFRFIGPASIPELVVAVAGSPAREGAAGSPAREGAAGSPAREGAAGSPARDGAAGPPGCRP